MNNEDKALLQDKLHGVTEFKHDIINGGYDCSKCNADLHHYKDYISPCPIPDPLPGSEADQAKKVRLYFLKQDESLKREYFTQLMKIWSDTSKEFAFTAWLIYCTDSDKLAAAVNVFRNMKP